MTTAVHFLLLALLRASSAQACDDLADDLQERLESTKMAMEPESALGAIYEQSTEAGERCAANESLTYLRLRAAELGKGATIGRQPASSRDEWRALARTLSARFPKSVRIATVAARATAAVADGQRAVALDPSYAPAQVALAAALLSTKPQESVHILETVKALDKVSDGYTVLAQARFALHDLDGAVAAANLALRRRDINLIEPDARDPRPVSGAREIVGLVYLEKHDYRKAAKELEAASTDSERARSILENPPAGLKKVLPRRTRAANAR